ncbi:type III secretion inner membrane ring lipoprotein SctJ [Alsobacter sp. SYSU M60028]|uniref:Lipoprotein n=1 Tax=Alsobacter ponti TaxID=2962936 RepID=A0ABT1LDF8_9HYPH|nr:type III secretion inner membrane ring lipoprotein SctJ [Alsobacter ponti]MCP8939537.1 type III secretion inner membrane ring lipoprotein SctJ [Alsobacter ponti]
MSQRIRPSRFLAIAGLALALCACDADLYSSLTEGEANEIVAALSVRGIPASKQSRGKEGFTVAVDSKDMVRAMAVLKDTGLPRPSHDSLGKVFQKSGIMSSPFEERVRFIYALAEEVSKTLSQIDGVVSARVHIVQPEAPQLGQAPKPSSAAVFIKHQPGIDLDYAVPQIRRLVSSAIEGLDYSAVTVVLTAAAVQTPTETVRVTQVLPGLAVQAGTEERFWLFAGLVAALSAILAAGTSALVAVLRRRSPASPPASAGTAPLVEPS